mmetsp:Transcript_35610/g.89428  ORF Transcript_35610/g.89428 Transcript_35610/m.89428 type:complete len:318 (+) Transcript_35610:1353-2306(+)
MRRHLGLVLRLHLVPHRLRLLARHRLEHLAHVGEVLQRVVNRHLEVHGLEGGHQLIHVHGVARVHHARKGEVHVGLEALGEAKVKQHRHGRIAAVLLRAGAHQDVAGVRVCVEEAVDVHLHCPGVAHAMQQRLAIHAVLVHQLQAAHREAVAKLHHQHAPAQHVVARRRHDGAHARSLHVGRHLLERPRLDAHVQLLLHGWLPLIHDLAEVVVRLQPGDDAAQGREIRQVAPHPRRHPAVLHLHHHLLPASQLGPVDLRHRGRAEGRLIQLDERIPPAGPELLPQREVHLFPGVGRHVILKGHQTLDVWDRDDINAG